MMLEAIRYFPRYDVELIVDFLRGLYERRPSDVPSKPILRGGGTELDGYPISDSRFRIIEPRQHKKKVLAVDASLRVFFDCGIFRMVVAKIAIATWRGRDREDNHGNSWRIGVARDVREASEFLLRVEIEELLRHLDRMGRGDYCLLDRQLIIPSYIMATTRALVLSFIERARRLGAIAVGISKRCSLSTSTGESLTGYLSYRARRRFKDFPWYYHPLFSSSSLPGRFLGDIVVAKLCEGRGHALRIDVDRSLLSEDVDVGDVMDEISFLQDISSSGYPYPLKEVHEESSISRSEIEILKLSFEDLLDELGLLDRFVDDVRSASCRESIFWGVAH